MTGNDAQALTALIEDLEKQLAALTQQWEVYSLDKSYLGAAVYGALIACYDRLRFAAD